MRLKFFFVLFICLSSASFVKAEHLVGGEIFYECLGSDDYRITLKVYRDCYSSGAPFDDPAAIGIFNAAGALVTTLSAPYNGSQLLDVVINNPCLQAPPDICVEEAIYTITAHLPFIAGGYYVAYQRCCRNQSIINLTSPGSQGSTYYVEIPEEALNSCNSSPYFNNFPPLALCIGDELIFDHSATDPDGDQLVYSLCTPFHGGSQAMPAPVPPDAPPYTNINWNSGYSNAYPIDASPALTIDPVTGELTGVPTQAGQYVVGVCVEEYRNGQLISINKRDFQFNVVNCSSNIQAVIPVQSSFHDPCSGLQVSFGNNSINAQYFHWDFGIEGILSDTSNLEDPVFTYPDTGSYVVTLVANPGFGCADSTVAIVEVFEQIVADIVIDGDVCSDSNEFDFQASGTFGGGATFQWEFTNGLPATSTDQNPTGISFEALGTFQISLTVTDNICSDQTSTTIQTLPRPDAYFPSGDLRGCAPLGILFLDSSYAATSYELSWDFGDGTSATGERELHQYLESGIYDVSLTIWTSNGCVDTSTYLVQQPVEVWPIPDGELTVDTNIQFVFDPVFNFTGTTSSATECALFTGDGASFSDQVPMCEYEHFYTDTGNYEAIMIFTDDNGCQTSDTVWIRVEPEVRFWIPNAFTPNDDRINDTWGPKAFGFSEYEMWVYDRWGKLIFHSTDPFEKWNGTLNNRGNQIMPLGVYAYRILARSVKNTIIKESGHVTLLK
ncbi:MAG: gliding motility-associated C-terminal domain-containing protein [Flavobacteriales bacterium]|nr:gliding motility-associated C-terminal domain-containing protein [Flavobacteriales bacterium]